MRSIVISFIICFTSLACFSQKAILDKYSYVVVPDQYSFSSSPDQYKLNSMSVFYLEKSGFNAFLKSTVPNLNRCEGLFMDVEELSMFLGTKLEVVFRDCNGNEIYRGGEGKSRYKEYEKAYQDALRKAFKNLESLRVQQKDVVPQKDGDREMATANESSVANIVKGDNNVLLPTAKYLNYGRDGKSYLLRKTAEGYSLYQENGNAEDGLALQGKIVILDRLVKYLENTGKVYNAHFDQDGNLTIDNESYSATYKLMD